LLLTDATGLLSAALAEHYNVERELGRGGMATVYLAHDRKHERKVAIKVLKPELSAVLGAERFLQEIKVTAHLQHPHILPLFDSGIVEGLVYYVMPYVAGESLRQALRRERQFPIEDAVRIAGEVASALDYAHRQGVIHRDIKPENILLHENQAIVADFGIALAVRAAGGPRVTETGLSLGTPEYMSPEQAAADRALDARSDIYSLGAVLYEMLTGEPPHTGATVQTVIARLLTERPTHPRTIRDAVPGRLDAVVMKALERTPADRYRSAAELARALDQESHEVPTRTVRLKAGTPPRARRAILLAAGALALILPAFIAVMVLQSREIPSTVRRPITTFGDAADPELSPDGRMVAYVASRESLMVQDLSGGRPVTVASGATALRMPRWSRDGTTLFFLGEFPGVVAGVYTVPRLGGVPRRITDANLAYALHPAGDRLMASFLDPRVGNRLTVVRIVDGMVLDTLPVARLSGSYRGWGTERPYVMWRIEWSPDGKWLAFVGSMKRDSSNFTLGVMSPAGEIAGLRVQMNNVARWNVEGDALYYFPVRTANEWDLEKLRVNRRTGKFEGSPRVVQSRIPGLNGNFSTNGPTLAYLSGNRNSQVATAELDLKARQIKTQVVTSGTGWHETPTVSGDGRTIAYIETDAMAGNIYTRPFERGPATPLRTEQNPDYAWPSLAPDGRRLLFTRKQPRRALMLGVLGGGMPTPVRVPDALPWEAVSSRAQWVTPSVIAFPSGIDGRRYVLHDLTTGADRELVLPESLGIKPTRVQLGRIIDPGEVPVFSPGGDEVAVVGVSRGRPAIYRVSVSTLEASLVTTLAEDPVGLSRWTVDGWIWFIRRDGPGQPHRLSRVRAGGSAPELSMELPNGCTMWPQETSVDMSRATCNPSSGSLDVWVAEHFDPDAE
jgi:eukaryotic-like serine/threonine-protein kinase